METIVLRKRSSTRTVTLDGTVVRMQIGRRQESRTSWLTGVMARASRDKIVAGLVAEGWTAEPTRLRKKARSKRPMLSPADIDVLGETPAHVATPSTDRAWPAGYVAFLERFGSGELEDLLVLSPAKVTKSTQDWKDMADSAEGLFENLRECFPAKDEASVIVVAISQNGDVMGFPDSRPSELFLFPRGSQRILSMGSSFDEALGAWCYGEDIAPRRVEGRRAIFRIRERA